MFKGNSGLLRRASALLAALALVIVPVISMTSIALADQKQVDNDLATTGNQNIVNIAAAAGATVNTSGQVVINYSGRNHLDPGTNVSFSVAGSVTGQARYDAVAGQYIYNLSTKGMSAGSLNITVTLNDGTSHNVVVTLK